MSSYQRPSSLADALAAMGASPAPVVVAGATDHFPARVGRHMDEDIIDITAVDGLRGIVSTGAGWRIGALTTWRDVIEADLPPLFDGLRAAARTIGGPQVQERGTLAGNLVNASPAADGIPNLLAFDAEVELVSAGGWRRLPVPDFVTGYRHTERRPDELLAAIHVPARAAGTRAAFLKLGSRASLVISIVMVAAVLEPDADGRIVAAGIAVGACSPVARRLPMLEARLVGQPMAAGLDDAARASDLGTLAPIDDVRASAAYRREVALVLVRRALAEAVA